jgi:hypothetical protein
MHDRYIVSDCCTAELLHTRMLAACDTWHPWLNGTRTSSAPKVAISRFASRFIRRHCLVVVNRWRVALLLLHDVAHLLPITPTTGSSSRSLFTGRQLVGAHALLPRYAALVLGDSGHHAVDVLPSADPGG